VGLVSHIDPIVYKTIWWAMGHGSQQINVAVHVSVWYAIAALTFGAKPLSEKVSRMAFLMYILFLQLASAHHLLVEPGLSSEWKIFNTSYAMYLAVLGSMIHGMTVPGSIEVAQRARGYTKGMFEWLRKAPWSNPAFAGMFMSLVFFGFIGGISGVVMGTEQINLIMHNTLYVPGHFHGTVVAGTTLAFMAITYLLIPLIFRRELAMRKLAQWQPYVFGIGVAGISIFMMGAGTLGVARRHWDMTFADAQLPFDYPSAAYLMMGLNGIFAIMAAIGGLMFIVIVIRSVFFGRKLAENEKPDYPEVPPQAAVVSHYGSAEKLHIPGTIFMVSIFFVAFVLYYFVNWKYLSEIWPLS
jgi:cytochrome c oxidase subunit 1